MDGCVTILTAPSLESIPAMPGLWHTYSCTRLSDSSVVVAVPPALLPLLPQVQVPLMLTVYMLLSFKQFKLLGEGAERLDAPEDDFFQVPTGYTEVRWGIWGQGIHVLRQKRPMNW